MIDISRVSILCFAASYSVAFVLEVTRLFFRSGVRGAVMLGFSGAGILAHTIYLVNQALQVQTMGVNGSLFASMQDWMLVAAWFLVIVYLSLTYRYPKTPFGLMMLPLALVLIGIAWSMVESKPATRMPASQLLGVVHGASLLLATVAVLFGLSAGLMYLGQAYRLKRKAPLKQGLRLPSLEWLQRANSRAIAAAMIMLAAGILTGLGLNIALEQQSETALRWSDPVVLSTSGLFLWLLAGWILGFFYKPAREGRKVAYFTVLSFGFILAVLALALTQHANRRQTADGDARAHAVDRHPSGNFQPATASSSLRTSSHAFPGSRV